MADQAARIASVPEELHPILYSDPTAHALLYLWAGGDDPLQALLVALIKALHDDKLRAFAEWKHCMERSTAPAAGLLWPGRR